MQVLRELTKYKHWFQHNNVTKIVPGTLVLALFRNPYEWVQAMRRSPHHASNHVGLGWREFLERPWTTERVGRDLDLWREINRTEREAKVGEGGEEDHLRNGKFFRKSRICQDSFRFDEVISCYKHPVPDEYWEERSHSYSQRQPLYEMRQDGSGLPYKSILELRSDKIRNFLSTLDFNRVWDTWTVQYEDLVKDGTEILVRSLEEEAGIKARCKPELPQKGRRKRMIGIDLVQYLVDHVDWEAEALIGYTK